MKERETMIEQIACHRWRAMGHLCGIVDDLPAVLHALASPVEHTRERAKWQLSGEIFYHYSRYEIDLFVAPFLIELVTYQLWPDRDAIVRADEETQALRLWENETLDGRYLEAVARRWPVWRVQGHVEGVVRHVILSGRDSATVKISDQQAVQELITAFQGNDRELQALGRLQCQNLHTGPL